MIRGVVTDDLEAWVDLAVVEVGRPSVGFSAVIDTGFNGYLTLPMAVLEKYQAKPLIQVAVTLANGSQHPALPMVQDAASQFVQMTWLFTTQPALLQVGNAITISLALPRRAGVWVYDVLGQERLNTPVGELDTFHLKPRLGERRPGNELSAEVWFAPTLQYLPVRIRIQQEAGTFVDLMLDAAPLQAAPPGAAPAPR